MKSNPVVPTRGVSNCHQLRSRCKQVAKFTFPHRTSPSHHWQPNQGALNWRSPNTGVGRGAPQWRARSAMENKPSHCKGERLQRESLRFPSLSIFPIHPDAWSPHPDTSINSSLPTQVPHSIHHLVPLPYLPQIQPSHHFHCYHLSLSHQRAKLWEPCLEI